MERFTTLSAIAAPLPLANVDTDKILEARFLKTIARSGLGNKLFWTLRQNPDFILNQAPWSRAQILVVHSNFGCGSSREHAPWALFDFGIRCIIAPSFADIFYGNCFKNGILPVVLANAEIDRLMALATNPFTATMTVDLERQLVRSNDRRAVAFAIETGRKLDLLYGIDDIARSLAMLPHIERFEAGHCMVQPWIVPLRGDLGA